MIENCNGHIYFFIFEKLLYFWDLCRKQKMMQENNENWGNQVFIDGKDKLFGRRDLMSIKQNGMPCCISYANIVL